MRVTRVVLACLIALTMAGCEARSETSADTDAQSSSAPPGMDESLRDSALALIAAREKALIAHDREAFLATIDPAAEDFVETQARWFDNLVQLPVTDLSIELGDEDSMTLVHGEGGLQLPVDFTMRLKGFDAEAVTQWQIYTFEHSGDGALLANDRNKQYDAVRNWVPAPWDLAAIEVRSSGSALAVFDEDTVGSADEVMADLDQAAQFVKNFVSNGSQRFIVYDIADRQAMGRWSPRKVGRTAAVAFPGPRDNSGLEAYRFMINPRFTGDRLSRSLAFRRELVHVARQGADTRSPAWLREGIAQYVAQSTMTALARRHLAAELLEGVEPRSLEASSRFYSRQPEINYALAALVCDYLATTRGFDVLQGLELRMGSGDWVMWSQTESIARRELGISTRDLTRDALAWARSA